MTQIKLIMGPIKRVKSFANSNISWLRKVGAKLAVKKLENRLSVAPEGRIRQ